MYNCLIQNTSHSFSDKKNKSIFVLFFNTLIFAALQRGLYRVYGTMIAVALVHEGLFPSFFSKRLYQNLCSIPSSPPTLEEIADLDLKWKLKKV